MLAVWVPWIQFRRRATPDEGLLYVKNLEPERQLSQSSIMIDSQQVRMDSVSC
jgi:hypothetical protein